MLAPIMFPMYMNYINENIEMESYMNMEHVQLASKYESSLTYINKEMVKQIIV